MEKQVEIPSFMQRPTKEDIKYCIKYTKLRNLWFYLQGFISGCIVCNLLYLIVNAMG